MIYSWLVAPALRPKPLPPHVPRRGGGRGAPAAAAPPQRRLPRAESGVALAIAATTLEVGGVLCRASRQFLLVVEETHNMHINDVYK